MKAGAERFQLGPGAAAVVPRGVPHTLPRRQRNRRVLLLSTPAGIERFVRDASVPAAAPTLPPPDAPRPTPEELERIYREHACIEVGSRISHAD